MWHSRNSLSLPEMTRKKNRFEFLEEFDKEKRRWIVTRMRAYQGHSVKGLEEGAGKVKIGFDNMPKQLVHGTFLRRMEAILKNGLIPGGTAKDSRNENHFTPVEAWDKETPGYRYESDITFYFNLTALIRDGFDFWWTKSGAIVSTAIIPPKYMLKVVVNKTREVRWVSPRVTPPKVRGEPPAVSPDVTTRGETLAGTNTSGAVSFRRLRVSKCTTRGETQV